MHPTCGGSGSVRTWHTVWLRLNEDGTSRHVRVYRCVDRLLGRVHDRLSSIRWLKLKAAHVLSRDEIDKEHQANRSGFCLLSDALEYDTSVVLISENIANVEDGGRGGIYS